MHARREAIRQLIDSLINRLGEDRPDLVEDLIKARNELDKPGLSEYASFGVLFMHIAHIAKWVYDHLP